MKYQHDAIDLAWTLLPDELLVIREMDDFMGYPARRLARDTGLSETRVKCAQRGIHARNLADFGPLFDEDDGKLCGRGYWLNAIGHAVQRAMRRALPGIWS